MNLQFKSWLILIILALIWGSSFILMHEGLKTFTPIQVASYRLSIGSIFFIPIVLKNLNVLNKNNWKWMLGAGFLGNFFPAFMFAYGLKYLETSTEGILNALTPLFTLLIAFFVLKKHISAKKWIGIILGLLGAVLLIYLQKNSENNTYILYGLIVVLATLFYGANINLIEHKLGGLKPLLVAAFPLSMICIPSLITLSFSGVHFDQISNEQGFKSLLAISVLGIFGTGISLIFFNKLIQMTDSVFASSVTYLMPVVSVGWGLLEHEPFGIYQGLSLILILLGIWLVKTNKKSLLNS